MIIAQWADELVRRGRCLFSVGRLPGGRQGIQCRHETLFRITGLLGEFRNRAGASPRELGGGYESNSEAGMSNKIHRRLFLGGGAGLGAWLSGRQQV